MCELNYRWVGYDLRNVNNSSIILSGVTSSVCLLWFISALCVSAIMDYANIRKCTPTIL